jgi:hypothetical protein
MEKIRIKFKGPHQDKGKMNPPIPLVMGIVTLFDWRMRYFLLFIGPKDSHPKLDWMALHFQVLIGPLKDEEAIDWCKGFRGFHWLRGASSRGQGGSKRIEGVCVCVWKK